MRSAVSLLFAPGARPSAEDIAALARSRAGFLVSHAPAGSDAEGLVWLELLTNGLAFDCLGLAGGAPATSPPQAHSFGLTEIPTRLDAITLQPGPHLIEGSAMLPVIRSLALLAGRLSELPGVAAIAWHPARCWSAPERFREAVTRWVEGGAFPVFSLAALSPAADGGLQSEGLALFTGQELRVEPDPRIDQADAGKIALRLVHWLVDHGALTADAQLTAPDGSILRLSPSTNGRFVRAWLG